MNMITKYENQELTDNEKYVQMEGQYEEYEEYKQEQEQQIYTKLLMKYDNLMILKIFLSNNDETFSNIYEEANYSINQARAPVLSPPSHNLPSSQRPGGPGSRFRSKCRDARNEPPGVRRCREVYRSGKTRLWHSGCD